MIIKKNATVLALATFAISCQFIGSKENENDDQNQKPLNVLFIASDDMRYQANAFGQENMITPGLDRLASEGVTFNRAYCNVPVCGASRASLLSGVRPTQNRFLNYYTRKDNDFPDHPSLPMWFKQHDYKTVSLGKIYHHGDDDIQAWSMPPWDHQQEIGVGWQSYITEEAHQIIDANRTDENPHEVIGPAWEAADVPDNGYPDGLLAERAIEQLKSFSQSGESFFLGVGFTKPHLPFNAPEKYWNLYNEDDLEFADNPFKPVDAPDAAMHNWEELRNMYHDIPDEGPVSKETEKKLVHGYYACVSYVDAQIIKLLDALKKYGLEENTVVVFWGDHGFHLGEHGLWAKHCNFNRVLSAPVIVKAPNIKKNKTTNTLVEFIDIYPSVVELAGLSLPDHLDGKSFVPTLQDHSVKHKDAVFSRYINGESVKTDQYLYTEWINDDGQIYARMLYDHEKDPKENINLSEDSDYKYIVQEHHLLLQELREKQN
ncbi:MAG: sulfatase [Bacteroidota bacterium]